MPAPAVPLPEVTTVGDHDVLVWQLPQPVLAMASAPLGGGMGCLMMILVSVVLSVLLTVVLNLGR